MINVSEATANAGALQRLSGAGVSVWLDGLSRTDLTSGALAALVRSGAVTGITAGPAASSPGCRA